MTWRAMLRVPRRSHATHVVYSLHRNGSVSFVVNSGDDAFLNHDVGLPEMA
jgi:hypothetical protein